jgi:hypothetical protein
MPDRLQKFLAGSDRSRSREYVLTTKLVHDLSVAAVSSGYDLLVYLPTVDADGFDVVFDDRDRLVAIQLKSVVGGGKAAGWDIRRSLLRPQPEETEVFGFAPSPTGSGRGGGVILITADAVGGAIRVRYSYTDIVVLSVLWEDIVSKPEPQRARLKKLRQELEADTSGSVRVPRSAFFSAATPQQLLALAGLHSSVDNSWRFQTITLLKHLHLQRPLRCPEADLRRMIREQLVDFGTVPANTR